VTRHAEPEIDAFLAIGFYDTVEDWMADSGYEEDPDGPTGWLTEDGDPIWPTDAIAGAMEACHDDDERELRDLEAELAEIGNRETFGHRAKLLQQIDLYLTRLGLS